MQKKDMQKESDVKEDKIEGAEEEKCKGLIDILNAITDKGFLRMLNNCNTRKKVDKSLKIAALGRI